MRVLFINSVCGVGSTGRICTDLAQQLEAEGNEVKIAYGRKGTVPEQFEKYAVRIGTDLDCKIHALQTRLFDTHGFGSKHATKKFLEWAENYNPDLLWLHNIHGYYINVEMLFDWIKKNPEMQVKWTLHDCWAFTGHCTHFTVAKCEQWKKQCTHCSQLHQYPACFGRGSVRKNFERKESVFTGVKNMTLITPSKWLANLTRESFLKEYPVEVHYNTIDTSIFQPTASDFRERNCLQDKMIVLGVANVWEGRKGLLDFYKLAQMLDSKYAIVLVGLNEKQIRNLPQNIRGLQKNICSQEVAVSYTVTELTAKTYAEKTLDVELSKFHAYEKKEDKNCTQFTTQSDNVVISQNVNALYKAITGDIYDCNNRKKLGGCRIVCIPRTNSPKELAAIYTAADVFANPTYEDNYPTVNLEAQACGTRVVTYDTGGCRETVGMQI